ncbi:MAG: HAMP domain-containing sensor histidine kinase, partial [Candidatus Paceibacterota bacterium]
LNLLAVRYYDRTELGIDGLSQYGTVFSELRDGAFPQDKFIEVIREIRQSDLSTIRRSSFFIFALLVGLSLVGGNAISAQVLSPIKDINKQIKAIQAESMDKISYPHIDEELQELISAINGMLLRLGKSFRSQKEFIEYASHELKTPLSVMMAKTDLILTDNELSNDNIQLLQEIQNKIDYLNDLINDLSLLSLSKEHLQFDSISIQSILDTILNNISAKAQQKNINIILKGQSLDKKIKLVPILITQAVENIIENAIKYSQNNSEIEVETKIYKNFLTMYIKDTGIGIPEHLIHRIFDKFYRVDNSRSKHTGGRGLGLTLTKAIIELHNGTIKVHSKEGEGTVFTLHIPIG